MVDRKKVAGIILAAGESLRMGKTKQLLNFRGKLLLQWVIDSALESQLDKVVLVLGHEFHKIKAALDCSRVTVILNADYQQGQSSSLKAGLKQLKDDYDGVMFILGDQPLVNAATLNELLAAYQSNQTPITAPTFRGKPGNPVLMDCSLFPELKNLSGDVGGRVLKQTYADKILHVPVSDSGILVDLDTPDDYHQILNGATDPHFNENTGRSDHKRKLFHILGIEKNSVISVTGGGGKTTTIFTIAQEVAAEGWSVLITTTTAMLHPDLESQEYDQLFINEDHMLPIQEKNWGSGITIAARMFDYKTGKTLGFDPQVIDKLSAASIYDLILVEADGAKNLPIKAPAAHEPVIPESTNMVLGLIGLDALDKPLNERYVHRPQQLSELSGVTIDSPITGQVIEALVHSPLGVFKGSPTAAQQVVILNKAATADHAEKGRQIGETILANSDQIAMVLICEMQAADPVLDWIKAEKK